MSIIVHFFCYIFAPSEINIPSVPHNMVFNFNSIGFYRGYFHKFGDLLNLFAKIDYSEHYNFSLEINISDYDDLVKFLKIAQEFDSCSCVSDN